MAGRQWAALTITALLVVGGCGTRVGQSHGDAAATPVTAQPGAAGAIGEGTAGGSAEDFQTETGRSAPPGPRSAGPTAGAAAGIGTATPASTPPSSRPATAPAGSTATGSGAASSAGGPSSATGTNDPLPGPTTPHTGAPTLAGGAKSVVKIGSVGTHSGPVGGVLRGAIEALQVWQRMVNDRGGLNGHPVKIIFIDDGGESARHLAAKKELVEREKVVAFVQDSTPIGNGRTAIPYIEQKRVPVIGSETGSNWFYDSPMYFPQAPSGDYAFYAGVNSHSRALALGKKKLATLACAEVGACQDADRIYATYAPRLGFDHVYRARVSVTQPDFTAECLAARNAGADFLVFAGDTASITRATTSCARQNYRPTLGLQMSMIADAQKKDANLAGALGMSNIFPWFQSNTPATAEFHSAIQRYLPNAQLGIAHATAWTSAKLLEKAGAGMPEPPTSEAFLQGLWQMEDETLGGLTKVSFIKNKPAPKIVCWFDIAIRDQQWVSADNFALHCVDAPAKL